MRSYDASEDSARGPGTAAALPAALLAAIALLLVFDMIADFGRGQGVVHLAVEGAAAALGVFGAGALARRWRAERRAAAETLAAARADARRWREEAARWRAEAREALTAFGEAIDRQFERWALSPAEREVALLLLKGLSLKEIADARSTGERTARQQALAVYRKAGLAGRAELAAFFFEDLLVPPPEDPERRRA